MTCFRRGAAVIVSTLVPAYLRLIKFAGNKGQEKEL